MRRRVGVFECCSHAVVSRACGQTPGVTGIPRAAMLGQAWVQYIHPADLPGVIATSVEKMASRADYELHYRTVTGKAIHAVVLHHAPDRWLAFLAESQVEVDRSELLGMHLRATLTHWQRILLLSFWEIQVEYTDKLSVSAGSIRCGQLLYSDLDLYAKILVLQERDYSDACLLPYDLDRILVHELLHLRVPPSAEELGNPILLGEYETRINLLARSFVDLERRTIYSHTTPGALSTPGLPEPVHPCCQKINPRDPTMI